MGPVCSYSRAALGLCRRIRPAGLAPLLESSGRKSRWGEPNLPAYCRLWGSPRCLLSPVIPRTAQPPPRRLPHCSLVRGLGRGLRNTFVELHRNEPRVMERNIEAQPASVIVGCHRAVQSGGLRPDRQHTTLTHSTRKVFSPSGPFPEKKKKQKSVSKALAMHGWFSLLSSLTTKTETSATSLGAQRQ